MKEKEIEKEGHLLSSSVDRRPVFGFDIFDLGCDRW